MRICKNQQYYYRTMNKILFIFIILLSFANQAMADSNQGLMEVAARQYSDGNYSEAITTYNQILSTGYESAELYYNLGNSYYKTSDLPNSILFYEKAKLLTPNDEDIIFNLDLARSHTMDKIDEIPEFFIYSWINRLAGILLADTWAIISMISFAISLIIFIIYFISGYLIIKKLSFYSATVVLLVSIATFIFSYKESSKIIRHDSAIIFSPSITIKSSPDDNGNDLFLLHEGTKVHLLDSLSEWYEIQLADGNEGWLKKESIEII